MTARLLCFVLLLLSSPLAAKDEQKGKEDRIELLKKIMGIVKREHIQPKNDEELFKAAVNGMLSSLDPHSAWLDPGTYHEMQESTKGEFGGLGIEVIMDKGYIKVVSPISATPAERAGILAGDLVTHLDGKSVLGMTLSDAVRVMRGKPQTDIILTIKRLGYKTAFDVKLTRAIIKIKAVRAKHFDRIAYLRLITFNEKAVKGLIRAINRAQKEIDPQGYILDLRNNPGGLLDQAVLVTDLFLRSGEIVSIRNRARASWFEMSNRYHARAGDITHGKPMIVLINGGSASASEIVAGALQDHHRAITLGTLSFGKGSVQTVRPLGKGNGALRLTTARYYTPSGRSIQAKGVLPDIIVRQKLDKEAQQMLNIAGETSLPRHLDSKRNNRHSGSVSYVPRDDKKDVQLHYALDLLQSVIVANFSEQKREGLF